MKNFFWQAPWRLRAGLLGTAAALSCAPLAANAQNFTHIQAFGDSYVDTGNLFRILGPNPVYPTGRFSGGTNYVDTLQALMGGVGVSNYAVGGSMTGGNVIPVPGLPGFAAQWRNFLNSGNRIDPNQLALVNIGGNDARNYYMSGGTIAAANGAAQNAANAAMQGVGALVGAGARTIVFTAGDAGVAPEASSPLNPAAGNSAAGSAFSKNYNLQTQQMLAPYARMGVRVEYVDIGMIGQMVTANPGLYGLKSADACPTQCLGDPTLQNKYLFYVDGLHLTSAGFAIMARYIDNRLKAPLTIGPQGDMAMQTTHGFVQQMFGRLDLFNALSTIAPERALIARAYAPEASVKGPLANLPAVAAEPSPLSFYILANGGFGSRSATRASNGYEWENVGGSVGLEYRVNSQAMIGAAFNFSNPYLQQYNGAGVNDMDAYQLGVYGAWMGQNLFTQAAFSFGLLNYRNWRPGVVSSITSNPQGSSFAVAGKTGYLLDLSDRLRLGPLVGFAYASSTVNRHEEIGDPVLTLRVQDQNLDAAVGQAGAQARTSFIWGSSAYNFYLNLTAEKNFSGSGRLVEYGALSAPLIVNRWAAPTRDRDVYGRVAVGAATDVWSNVGLTINLSQTFGRKGGDDFGGQAGIKMAF